jgi:cytoskeletal protein RodZ
LESYGIGARLQGKRIDLGRSLDDIVGQTKIQLHFLEAIEKEDLSVFPGIIFARNFVRQYAIALELDPQPLLDAMPKLDQASVPLPEAPARARARRTRLSGGPHWTSAAWALAAALAVTGAYLYQDQGWRITLERKAPAEQDTVKAQSLPAPEPVRQQTATVADPPPAAPAAISEPSSNEPVQVVLTAHERAWVGIKIDGKSGYAWIGTLNPEETRTVSAASQVNVMTGNAGGLTISLNGKVLDPIGRHGQSRTVRLTAEGSELLSKEVSPPPPPATSAAAGDQL